jgi:hypothetical protein
MASKLDIPTFSLSDVRDVFVTRPKSRLTYVSPKFPNLAPRCGPACAQTARAQTARAQTARAQTARAQTARAQTARAQTARAHLQAPTLLHLIWVLRFCLVIN